MTDKEKKYIAEQEQLNFNIGDYVKVIRKAESDENGWFNSWESEMDEYVGNVYQVYNLHGSGGINIYHPEHEEAYSFPYFVLEKVNSPTKFKTLKKLNVITLMTSSGYLDSTKEQFEKDEKIHLTDGFFHILVPSTEWNLTNIITELNFLKTKKFYFFSSKEIRIWGTLK